MHDTFFSALEARQLPDRVVKQASVDWHAYSLSFPEARFSSPQKNRVHS
jgi:hypothetical protein